MKIVREEIFGPVIAMTKFSSEEEAIKAANDSNYGLSAGIFTQNLSRAHRLAAKLKSGTVWVSLRLELSLSLLKNAQVNCFNELHPQVPFGGYKESGESILQLWTPPEGYQRRHCRKKLIFQRYRSRTRPLRNRELYRDQGRARQPQWGAGYRAGGCLMSALRVCDGLA